MSTVNENTVLVRRLDVTARVTDQVAALSDRSEGGILLETLIGRYVLDRDAREVWLNIDGRRSVGETVSAIVEATGLREDEVAEPVNGLCARLLEHGLVEVVAPAGANVA